MCWQHFLGTTWIKAGELLDSNNWYCIILPFKEKWRDRDKTLFHLSPIFSSLFSSLSARSPHTTCNFFRVSSCLFFRIERQIFVTCFCPSFEDGLTFFFFLAMKFVRRNSFKSSLVLRKRRTGAINISPLYFKLNNSVHHIAVVSTMRSYCSNKSPTRCNNFPVYYPDVYLQLNMFRAFSRPSSGSQWLL